MAWTLYDGTLFILMLIMFTAAVWQLYDRLYWSGVLAVLAALGFIIVTALNGDLEMLSIILFLTGIILVIMELFVVGLVLGIAGLIMIASSFLLIGADIGKMSVFVASCMIIALIEWVIIVKFLSRKVPLFSKVILTDATSKEAGYTSHDDRSHLTGQLAVTATALRPSGIIALGQERIDAVSEGAFIGQHKEVRIIYVEGTRVVVREII
ncbi:NfeD family protein [Macrococcus equipercicus]|uniref:NfeD family protein n=1 Tax=Macrococcus equipercicus TaxID=69967 RepID=UPI001FE79930|nr:NfeD family protein [Macrococcus equipercicus]